MLSPQPELIWQGRIHLGDEPGVFGDACYSGLTAELPITLQKIDPSGPDTTTLIVQTHNVETFSGYPGHLITATLYEPDPNQQFHFLLKFRDHAAWRSQVSRRVWISSGVGASG